MATQNTNVRDKFLYRMMNNVKSVSVYLANGIKMVGSIEDYDDTGILLDANGGQFVSFSVISTIQPN